MANRIKMVRKSMGLTQKELGKMLGVGQTTVSAWELGRNEPDYEYLRKIAKLMECSIEYLMGDTTSETGTNVPPEQKETATFQETMEINRIFVKSNTTKAERKRAVEVVRAMFPDDKK